MAKVLLPLVYSQSDPKWAKMLLGNNTDPKFNFENYGCLISSLATISTYYGHAEDPLTLNKRVIDMAGFVNGGEYVWGTLQRIYPDITENVIQTPQALTDSQVKEIKDAVDAGKPVIALIDYNPKSLPVDYHFVVIVGYNENDENDFSIADPLGGTIHSLRSYLGWFKPSARASIEKYVIVNGPVPEDLPPIGGPAVAVKEEPIPAANPAPVNPLPANFPQIIHKSTQWDKTVEYLELGKSPDDASFEDAKRVVAGIKSRQTDLENKRKQAEEKTAEYQVTIDNQKEDIGILTKEMLNQEKIYKAQIEALKSNTPNVDNLRKQYEGVIDDLKKTLASKVGELQSTRIDQAKNELTEQEENTTSGKSVFDVLLAAIKHILVLKIR